MQCEDKVDDAARLTWTYPLVTREALRLSPLDRSCLARKLRRNLSQWKLENPGREGDNLAPYSLRLCLMRSTSIEVEKCCE